ncbi:uncharacterized protein Tco025E_08610 [Trypanosoma conorhini]|uniref:Uncharacterized protein n=1 Tax=Trypanosoma conorhini TaxID=83891 RepID=A0A3R7MF08_9TRYP|nr:uncharacterized protein Tco025E_08610 [Trypanosoma conorhini]RNF01328.1 hypothetical protein Tco025E_08610 [Trypanosoma conorhini]
MSAWRQKMPPQRGGDISTVGGRCPRLDAHREMREWRVQCEKRRSIIAAVSLLPHALSLAHPSSGRGERRGRVAGTHGAVVGVFILLRRQEGSGRSGAVPVQ